MAVTGMVYRLARSQTLLHRGRRVFEQGEHQVVDRLKPELAGKRKQLFLAERLYTLFERAPLTFHRR